MFSKRALKNRAIFRHNINDGNKRSLLIKEKQFVKERETLAQVKRTFEVFGEKAQGHGCIIRVFEPGTKERERERRK